MSLSEANEWSLKLKEKINSALEQYVPCKTANCSCHKSVIDQDLLPFKDGIDKELFELARSKGTKYQVRYWALKLFDSKLITIIGLNLLHMNTLLIKVSDKSIDLRFFGKQWWIKDKDKNVFWTIWVIATRNCSCLYKLQPDRQTS